MGCNKPHFITDDGRDLGIRCSIYKHFIEPDKTGAYKGYQCFDDDWQCPHWKGPRDTWRMLVDDIMNPKIGVCENAAACEYTCYHATPHIIDERCTSDPPFMMKGADMLSCNFECELITVSQEESKCLYSEYLKKR